MLLIPLGTTRPRQRVPWATFSLMTINIALIGYTLGDPDAINNAGFIPLDPSIWRWFISLFLHAGIFHLAGNMLFLWLFGTVVEDVLGPAMFLIFYFGGGACATLLDWSVSSAFTPVDLSMPRIGASGAIAGIMGVSAICFMRTKVHTFYLFTYFLMFKMGTVDIPVAWFGGLWVVWEVVQGFIMTSLASTLDVPVGGVAHWAHVGGFVFGLATALALRLRHRISQADILSGVASAEDTTGYYSQAGALEQVVQQQQTEDPETWLALGQAQEAENKERAAEAYSKALQLFLQQRKFPRAAEVYSIIKEYAKAETLPKGVFFDLACALEDSGRFFEAYPIFLLAAHEQAGTPRAETALIRAGEIARQELKSPEKAAEAYRMLIDNYPESRWVGMAIDGLRATGGPVRVVAAP